MVRKLLLILTLFLVQNSTYCQEEDQVLFSQALSLHFPKYEQKASAAYRYRDFERAEILFDSLVQHGLKGSYMDNFRFNRLNNKPVNLYDLKKPVYLITYASWCITTKGEIPALNQLAEKYHDRIDFVVLYWDTKKAAKQAAKNYNKYISVVYVDELYNKDAFVVSRLKHTLGLPTTFLIDETKEILDVRRGVSHPYAIGLQESTDMNYNTIFDGIANHLLKDGNFDSRQDPIAVNN